jgi:hypothetical protein
MNMQNQTLGAVLSVVLLGSGCVSTADRVANKEDLLAAAGFAALPASNPERQQLMAGLAANRFLSRVENDKLVYFFADPLVCNCIYVGDQAAYGRYRQEVFQRKIANEQQLTAMSYQDAQWNWGPWGPGWWH